MFRYGSSNGACPFVIFNLPWSSDQADIVSCSDLRACYPLPCPSAPCSGSFSVTEFFKDSPWLNVPIQRRGQILIEPLYPRLRLLGGSSSTTEGKVSKLAALAAARRKKEADKPSEGQSTRQSSSVTLLDKLSTSKKAEAEIDTTTTAASDSLSGNSKVNDENIPGQVRRYPLRRKKSPTPPSSLPQEPPKEKEPEAQQMQDTTTIKASPSMFARTVLGGQAKEPPLAVLHTDFKLPYITDPDFTKSKAFTGPSPDDIVTNAQAKGGAYVGKLSIRSK